MRDVVIVEGLRTPFGKLGGALSQFTAYDLGKIVLRELLERIELPRHEIDEIIWGCCFPPVQAMNIARTIALKSRVPAEIPAYTVQRNGAAGLQSVATGFYQIASGNARTVIAGGAESMSNFPLLFPEAFKVWLQQYRQLRSYREKFRHIRRFRRSHLTPVESLKFTIWDYACEMDLSGIADQLAHQFGIDRNAQDEYALESHQRAERASEKNWFREEIVPVYLPDPLETSTIHRDELILPAPQPGDFAGEDPLFSSIYSTATAKTIAPVGDGAAALLLMEESRAQSLVGAPALGRIKSIAFTGVPPEHAGLAPAYAAAKALQQCGMNMQDIQGMEIEETAASLVLANQKLFADRDFSAKILGKPGLLGELPVDKLNSNGGAIALGNPVGASAARCIISMLKTMQRRRMETGLVTMAIGGGQGGAIILERV